MNAKQKIILGILIVAILAASIPFFLNRGAQTNSGTTEITAILPLTGPASIYGEYEKVGMEMAIGDDSSSVVSVRFEDSQAKPDIAVSILEQNYNLRNSRVFIFSTTGPSTALLPILRDKEDENLAFVVASLSDMTTGFPSAIRIYPSISEEIRTIGSYAERMKYKSVAVLCVQNQAGEEAIQKMKERLSKYDGNLTFSDTFAASEKDFRQQLQKIKAGTPDAVLVIGYPSHYPIVFSQMAELGFEIPILAGMGVPLANFDVGLPLEFRTRIVFPASRFSYDKSFIAGQQFVSKLRTLGYEANYEIAFAYDTMKLILQSTEAGQSPNELRDAILKNLPFEGVNGTLLLNEHNDLQIELEPCRFGKTGIEKVVPEEKE